MTNSSELQTFRMGRLLCALACLLACLPSLAQQTAHVTPLNADEVIARVIEMNGVRAKALENYSSIRTYHLECHCLSHKKADMLVRVDYRAPNKKDFTILSESGSASVRNEVFKKLLEAEQESTQPENQQRSAITSDNYTFTLVDYQRTNAGDFYVLDAQPRTKNKFLLRGRIWVDGKDFAITRVEGEPAVNPSWTTNNGNGPRWFVRVVACAPNWLAAESVSARGCRLAQRYQCKLNTKCAIATKHQEQCSS